MRLFVCLFFAVSLNAADIGSPIPFPRDTSAKPGCDCTDCQCRDGRKSPDCTCRACRCADVSGRTIRAQIEETSDRPTPEKAASTKAKAGPEVQRVTYAQPVYYQPQYYQTPVYSYGAECVGNR